MKKIVLTGATSYIAVALMKKLLLYDNHIYAVIRPNSINRSKIPINEKITILECDLDSIDTIFQMSLPQIDLLYHFAWEGVRGQAREDSILQESNCIAAQKLIDASIKMKVKRFIGIGSQSEYGIMHCMTNEMCEEHPLTEYAKRKVQICHYGLEKAKEFNMKFVWARIFSLFGNGESESTLIMSCIKKMQENQVIYLSPCEHLWDFLYIMDAVDVLYKLGHEQIPNGIYNIASGDIRPLKEYVSELAEVLESSSVLKFGAIPYGANGPIGMVPDVSKIMNVLNWKPQYSFREGIKNMLERK